jgi:spermidine/putrescine transport system substrate-binding protein
MPNVKAQLIDNLEAPAWDPDRTYSVPWQSGLTGLAYNAKLTGEIRTLDDLLTRPDLKGRVTMLAGMQDSMQLVLLSLGKDPIEFSQDDFSAGIEKLEKAVASGQIRRFTGNDYSQDLANGDVAACMAWSGDVIQLQFENPDIKFVVPEEGLSIWSDNMMIPNKASHKANAETLMNYYYDPAVAAEVAAWVNYICPVAGAREAMEEIDPELVDNPLIFPDDELLKNAYGLMDLTDTQERNYEIQFQQVIGA